MSDIKRILLLDIDGVLLQPGGYREAVSAAINYFTRQAGLLDLAPEEEILAFFESKGITNEWDIVPICLAVILETMMSSFPEINLPEDWTSAAAIIKSLPVKTKRVDYRKIINEIVEYLQPGKSPSVSIYEAVRGGPGGEPFPCLSKSYLFDSLFQETKDVRKSLTTRIFQNYVLGGEVYRKIYGLEPLAAIPSYLDQFDRPNLSRLNGGKIDSLMKAGKLFPVAYTARPSLPPEGTVPQEAGFSPEAEMALRLVGIEDIPLIAYGRLKYAAQLFDVSTDLLIKPSPFQALAAICVAVMPDKDEKKALLFAGSICQAVGLIPSPVDLISGHSVFEPDLTDFLAHLSAYSLVIDVIEDSPIGIRAVKQACQILAEFHLSVTAHGWGVSLDASKRTALEAVGAVVYGSVDDAISSIFSTLDPS